MGAKIGFYICSFLTLMFEAMLTIILIDGGLNDFLTALWYAGIFFVVLFIVLEVLIFNFFCSMEKVSVFSKIVLILNVPVFLFTIILFPGFLKGEKKDKYVVKGNYLYKKKNIIAEIEFLAPNGDVVCKDGKIYNLKDLNSGKAKFK